MTPRALYATCPMGSTEWRVYACDPDDPDLTIDGDACDAVTLVDDGVILFARTVKRDRVPVLIVHELTHAAVATSGLGVTQKWNDDREEVIVRSLSTMLAHALVGGGLWRGRRVPR